MFETSDSDITVFSNAISASSDVSGTVEALPLNSSPARGHPEVQNLDTHCGHIWAQHWFAANSSYEFVL